MSALTPTLDACLQFAVALSTFLTLTEVWDRIKGR